MRLLMDKIDGELKRRVQMNDIHIGAHLDYKVFEIHGVWRICLNAAFRNNLNGKIEVDLKEIPLPIFGLEVQKYKDGKLVEEGTFFVGVKGTDVRNAYSNIKRYTPANLDEIDWMFEDEDFGIYPNPKEIDDKCKMLVGNVLRKNYRDSIPERFSYLKDIDLLSREEIAAAQEQGII